LKFKGGSKNNREGREGCEEKHENKPRLFYGHFEKFIFEQKETKGTKGGGFAAS
jgi:hypothetical protein